MTCIVISCVYNSWCHVHEHENPVAC